MDEIIEMAVQASKEWLKEFPTPEETARQVPKRFLEIFAKLVAAKEREACAEVAMTLTKRMKETEKAHYNNSAEPFIAERFGFDRALILEGQKIADAIRARGDQ